MTLTGNWSYPTQIRFGVGRISELSEACKTCGIKNPLFVTDRGLADLTVTQTVFNALSNADLFAEIDANPVDTNVSAGVTAYREGSHDGVIAFGGGSAMDVAKMVAFMQGQSRPIWDFEDIGDWWTRADPDAIAPIIAVPTTAGTGSEVGRASVITNSESREKKIIFHPKVLPSIVIADAELTVGMPPEITAGTGMDAFAHCLEAYCSPHYHPMSQGIALEGMRLVQQNLMTAYEAPENLEARANMLSAAMMGATAFQKGLGAIHAISHPIGALHNTHHGTTNAVVMQPVLRFNEVEIRTRLDQAAGYLGIAYGYEGFYDLVSTLNEALNIPQDLNALGVTEPDLGKLTEMALRDPSVGGNPVKMTPANTRALLESCFS